MRTHNHNKFQNMMNSTHNPFPHVNNKCKLANVNATKVSVQTMKCQKELKGNKSSRKNFQIKKMKKLRSFKKKKQIRIL